MYLISDQALKWYKEVLGFAVIKEPAEFVIDDSLGGRAIADFHGPNLKENEGGLAKFRESGRI